jgi:hypothetical protein
MIKFLMRLFGKKFKSESIPLYKDFLQHEHYHWSTIIKIQSERIQQLEQALQPFAQQGKIINLNESDSVPDFWHFRLNGSISAITVGDCKKAYDLLKPVIANKKETNIVDWATENLGTKNENS